jgi:hypothetical protein
MTAYDVAAQLKELKPALMARYKVRAISLFEAFIRGEQAEDSDIDLLTEFDDTADLFDLIGLKLCLEDTFNRAVDTVPKNLSLNLPLGRGAVAGGQSPAATTPDPEV